MEASDLNDANELSVQNNVERAVKYDNNNKYDDSDDDSVIANAVNKPIFTKTDEEQDAEADKEIAAEAAGVGGGRRRKSMKSKKSRKSRKSRKGKKSRKSRKSRKGRKSRRR